MGRQSGKRRSKAAEVDAVGSVTINLPSDTVWLDYLRQNEDFAKTLGKARLRYRDKFQQAYPNAARKPGVTVDDLRKRGHMHVAEEAELMGLKKI